MRPKAFSFLLLFLLLVGCEAPYVGNPSAIEENANVTLHVTGIEIVPFDDGNQASLVQSRAMQSITNYCSRLTFVLYQGDVKIRSVAQKRGDTEYGTVAFALPQGTYTVAIIGYNSDGACTVTSLDKISFKDNRVTDTFLHCQDIEVTDQPATYDVQLKRVVAMFRMLLTDQEIPSEAKQMKFYYTGGSSTLSALTSYGSVNSKQTVKIDIATGQKQFDVYTIPHDETGSLNITITALDANGNTLKERILNEVPVRRNAITRYTGKFFDDAEGSGSISFSMTAEGDWEDGAEGTF